MLIKDLALVVNTNSCNSDLWPMFYGQLSKYWPEAKSYTFSDIDVPFSTKTILYNKEDCFKDQYLSCIKQVSEKYILYLNEDYIIFDNINFDKLNEYIEILILTGYHFIRFTSTKEFHTKSVLSSTLYPIPFYSSNLYSQTLSLWKTRSLELIHEKGPKGEIGIKGDSTVHFESLANNICMQLGFDGLCHYDNEKQRGSVHFDNNVIPYTASAIIKGKWNTKEYSKELESLFKEYNIDCTKRGIY